MYIAMFIIVYHLHIVIVFSFCLHKISHLYEHDSRSPFMGIVIFLPKPRKDQKQYTLFTNGLLLRFCILLLLFTHLQCKNEIFNSDIHNSNPKPNYKYLVNTLDGKLCGRFCSLMATLYSASFKGI